MLAFGPGLWQYDYKPDGGETTVTASEQGYRPGLVDLGTGPTAFELPAVGGLPKLSKNAILNPGTVR